MRRTVYETENGSWLMMGLDSNSKKAREDFKLESE